MGIFKCDHIKWLITKTSNCIKRLSLYFTSQTIGSEILFKSGISLKITFLGYFSTTVRVFSSNKTNARERERGEIKSEKVCERKIEERDRVRKEGERVSEKEWRE